MRLTCGVDIINRLLPSHNLKKAARVKTSQLSIGKKPGNGPLKDGTLFLMVCTAADKNGTKYQIKGNLLQVFTKFVDEGKATIRFKEPEHDLCISKADPIQLKSFLSVLRLAVQGKSLDNITLSSLAPASNKNLELPKANLVILSRREYPITKNFPHTLEQLQVSECRMKRIDSRIFNLKRLVRLDLNQNCIEDIPEDLSKLDRLSELKLANNNLKTFPGMLCLKNSIQQTLTSLDLRNNQIHSLPVQICELRNLWCLKLDNNIIELLPPTIGRLSRLRVFTASNNKMKSLPSGFVRLRLEDVDLCGNDFQLTEDFVLSADVVAVPSLLESCARSIKKDKLPYSTEDLHTHLCHYLDSPRLCWCGNFCFECCVRYTIKTDIRSFASGVVAVDLAWGKSVPVEGFLCSPQCLNKFKANPVAFWR